MVGLTRIVRPGDPVHQTPAAALRARAASHQTTVRLRAAAQGGFTLIELLVSLTVLVVGILGAYVAFASSQRLSLVSERHSAMTQMAQKEIERIEGTDFANIALTSAPATSTDPTNPDYYVAAGSPPTLRYDRGSSSTESLDIDATNGTISPVTNWSEGSYSGQIYDFVTWTQDTRCAPSCTGSQNYKRITVAVTMTAGLLPTPVYVSSVIADPTAAPAGGCSGGTCGNPIVDPTTKCQNSSGQTVSCSNGINQGDANTWFLHNCAATNSSCSTPTQNSATKATSGPISGQTCTTSQSQAATASNVVGCPTPDLMDATSASGSLSTSLYNYSTDQCSTNCSGPAGTNTLCSANCTYTGGALLQPTCTSGLCGGGPIGSGGTGPAGSGGGTDATSDCTSGWSNTYLNTQSEMWATPALTSAMTLSGYGGLTVFTQTLGAAAEKVSFCAEVYDIPPSGSAGSLKDILAWPPTDLGGAAYVAATNPSTSSNWPSAMNEVTFDFNFRGSNGSVTVPSGDRIGVRIWIKADVNTPIALAYDNPNYPSQLQLNSE